MSKSKVAASILKVVIPSMSQGTDTDAHCWVIIFLLLCH